GGSLVARASRSVPPRVVTFAGGGPYRRVNATRRPNARGGAKFPASVEARRMDHGHPIAWGAADPPEALQYGCKTLNLLTKRTGACAPHGSRFLQGACLMLVTCPNCQAKYTVADDKVRGKTQAVQCRACGAKITVTESAPMPSARSYGS